MLPGEGARLVVSSLQLNMHSAGDVQVPILPGPFERAVHPARSVGEEVAGDGTTLARVDAWLFSPVNIPHSRWRSRVIIVVQTMRWMARLLLNACESFYYIYLLFS